MTTRPQGDGSSLTRAIAEPAPFQAAEPCTGSDCGVLPEPAPLQTAKPCSSGYDCGARLGRLAFG